MPSQQVTTCGVVFTTTRLGLVKKTAVEELPGPSTKTFTLVIEPLPGTIEEIKLSYQNLTALVDRIEMHLQQLGQEEVSSRVVGDMVIEGLKELDPIAYIRYAIVYLGLDNLASIRDMVDNLLGSVPARPDPVEGPELESE